MGIFDAFFVHCSFLIPGTFSLRYILTTGIQLADIVAYFVSWGLRFGPLTLPSRQELEPVEHGRGF